MSYPVITQQPADVTLHPGEEYYAEFTVIATCNVTPTYSWEIKDPDSNVWSNLYWTNPTLRYGTNSIWSSGTKFRCKVTGGGGDFIYSDEVTLTVEGPVNLIPLLPSNELETYNAIYAVGNTGEYEGVSYTVNSDGSIALNGTCTYQSGYSVYLYIISNVSSLYVGEKPRFWLSEGDYVLDLHAPSEGVYANLWAYTKSGGESYIVSHHRGENGPVSFHFDGDDDTLTGEITLNFEFKGGTTFNNFTFRPMLEYGTVGHTYAKPSIRGGYITYQPQNVVVNPGDTVTFSVGYAGYAPTFLWACREADVSGEGFSGVDTDKLTVVVPDSSTSYTLGCSINSSHSTDRFSSSAKLVMGIEINTTNFPDPLFRNYVSTFDLDKDGWLSKDEIQKATSFAPSQLDIGNMTSLKGLEYFTELTEIYIFANVYGKPYDKAQIASIDLTKCTKLKTLYIHRIDITELDLSKNIELERLSINNCSMSQLNFINNLRLWNIDIENISNLNSLDLSMLNDLRRLSIHYQGFTSLDISHNRKLTLLDLWGNRQLTFVDISCNPYLQTIYSCQSGIKEWDFTGHKSLYSASQTIPKVTTYDTGYKSWKFSGPNIGDLDPGSDVVRIECDIGTTFIDNGIVVVSQPTDVTVSDGENYSFTFQVSGSNLTYVWQKRANKNSPWITLNETTNTYSGTASSSDDGYEFRCIASDNTTSKESNIAALSVLHSPEILSDPESKNVLEGSQVTFSMTASGGDLRYQWQVSTDSGSTWNDIRYATEPDYELLAAMSMNGYAYRCVVTNDLGNTTSDAATLTVTPDSSLTPPFITEQPSSQQVSDGDTATFSLVASGEDIAYQWQTLKDGIWYSISGATLASYSVGANRLLNNAQYRCQVSNAIGSIYSDIVRLSVTSGSDISTPSIQIQPRSATVADGTAAMFATSASGGSLYFQWQVKRNGQWYAITGATNSIYTVVARQSMNGEQYRCQITNSAGTVYTNIVQLTVQSSAPLEFYGYHSLIISGKNTYGEWEMYPTSRPHVAPPEVKTSYVDVPGANGGLDYTDLLTGDPRYGYRKGSWEFLLIPQEKWPDVYRSLCNFLHGKIHTVVLEDDPTWQYTGRLSVNQWQSAAHNSLITIDYILDPIPVNLEDETYDQDADDLALATRILRKSANEGKVIALVNNQAMLTDPENYFEDGDEILY